MEAMASPWRLRKLASEEPVVERRNTKKYWNDNFSRLRGRHFAIQTRKPEGQRKEGKERKGRSTNTRNFFRGKCLLCEKLIATHFAVCKVYL